MIRLMSLDYIEHEGSPQEWTLKGLALSEANLLVGKNASGKSRTLNVIHALALHVAGLKGLGISGHYNAVFNKNGRTLNYILSYEDNEVLEEQFSVDGNVLLDRKAGGEGEIWAAEIDGGKTMRFQTPPSELAVVTRRDSIQHGFLEDLHTWGSTLYHYYFGTALGKAHMAIRSNSGPKAVNERDTEQVVGIFLLAKREFGEEYIQTIIRDMGQLGYEIEDLEVKAPVSIRVTGAPGEIVGLYVKEKALAGITDQHSMSQGMFRALSLLIQVNYSQLAGKSTCVVIDDIGEGLDFDRSCCLIDLLREKSKKSNIQLILSTNDKFVMNRVPLEEWSVIDRNGSQVKVLNINNSRSLFEKFKFTGLSNFSFLEMDFASGPSEDNSI